MLYRDLKKCMFACKKCNKGKISIFMIFKHSPQPIAFPFQIILLLLSVFLMAIIFTAMAAGVIAYIYGISDFQLLFDGSGNSEIPVSLLLIVQAFGAAGGFIVPAIAYAYYNGESPARFYQLSSKPEMKLIGLAMLAILFCQPLIAWSADLNQWLDISWMGSFGRWLDEINNEVQGSYETILQINSLSGFAILFIAAAIIPAIGEELIFRGALQTLMLKWTGRGHLAVWAAAFIFSIFHFQVYFILPRLLLGAGIGYLYLWSKNLWYSIIVHLINNGLIVTMAYLFISNGGKPEDFQNAEPFNILAGIFMTVALVIVLLIYKSQSLSKFDKTNHFEGNLPDYS
jgi:CAAX protease family protein